MIDIKVLKTLTAAGGEMNLEIDIGIENGQFVTIYGDSGAGKTSILRILAGLLEPQSGRIRMNGNCWFDSKEGINLKPQHRNIGLVFQDYALFPNMSVRQNLEYALRKGDNPKRIEELIDIVELGELKDRKPETLSGGQKQRVALARALVGRPQLLLLDEPLAALDAKIRMKLQDYLLRIHKEYNLTTILVSHDVGEILRLSDRLLILNSGKITHDGTPDEVFINKHISGKFKFSGEVVKIQKEDVVYVVSVLIQSSLVKVIAQESDVNALKIGDKVIVTSKAFNPLILKIDQPKSDGSPVD